MKKKSKRTLTPKLRFPEFRDAEGWKHKLLGPYLEDCSSRVSANTNLPVYSSTREGLKRQNAYFNGRELINKNEYGVVPHGCFVYRHMSDDGLFKFNVNDTGGDIAVSKEYPVFRTKGLSTLFLLNILNESPDFKQFAFSQKKGGTRTRLYFAKLCSWTTLLPSLPEQQKIAECLSSLDGLIAAEGRKLAALRDHKNGLMQQLFPQPGQTQPRLRFPEFRDKGEWEEKVLFDACLMQAGKFVAVSDIREQDEEGLYPCYGGNGLRGFTKSRTHDGIHPLIGRQGALCGNVRLARGEFHATEHAVVATPRKGVYVIWLFYMLDRLDLNRFATGQAQPGLSVDVLEKVPIAVPALEQEQQRIADCLTTLDSQIEAQAAKIDALKQHKRGLMQQLFPAAEEV